ENRVASRCAIRDKRIDRASLTVVGVVSSRGRLGKDWRSPPFTLRHVRARAPCAQAYRRRTWPGATIADDRKEIIVLTTLVVVLLVLWLLGLGTSYTLGGFIHVLP